jgi:hypothetical protein
VRKLGATLREEVAPDGRGFDAILWFAGGPVV